MLSDALARQLGYDNTLAAQDAVDKGQTIIRGGYIKTKFINTEDLTARRLIVNDDTGSVSVLPGVGLQLFKSGSGGGEPYTKTAEFRGEEKNGLGDIIPNYGGAGILISEKNEIVTSTQQTVTMATGRVPGSTASPMQVTIPRIYLIGNINGYFHIQRINGISPPTSYEICINAKLRVNGRYIGTPLYVQCNMKLHANPSSDYHLYKGEQMVTLSIASSTHSITTSQINNVNVSVEYFLSGDRPGMPTTSGINSQFFAKFSPDITSPLSTQYLKVGAAALNASFFGNGLIFSKSTSQYVGMMSTASDTRLEVRSGSQGVRLGADGISMLRPDNKWSAYGVLCGYRVNDLGNMITRFGMKDGIGSKSKRDAEGQYTITHNFGHTNYTVSVALITGKYDFYRITSVNANTTSIETRNSSGAFANREFMITFFG